MASPAHDHHTVGKLKMRPALALKLVSSLDQLENKIVFLAIENHLEAFNFVKEAIAKIY